VRRLLKPFQTARQEAGYSYSVVSTATTRWFHGRRRSSNSSRSITRSISRSIHSSSSRPRRVWPQRSNGCRQGGKEGSSWDCSARTGRRLVRRSTPSDHSPSEVEPTPSSRTTASMHMRRTEYVCVIGWDRSRPVSQSRPSIARIVGDRTPALPTRFSASSNEPSNCGRPPAPGTRRIELAAVVRRPGIPELRAQEAAGNVTGVTPTNENEDPTAVSTVAYSILDRMGTRERLIGGPPLVVYNNCPGTTAPDVMALLEDVRDRIRPYLRDRAKQ
jgi:hypothetical protein